ncbi:hypothetical protein [Paraglaciecola sp.]|uniref:hypothetical protein n=1 Tax=Paraglaciecola sp. TaxID=1920173 RepID=UPI003EF2C01F
MKKLLIALVVVLGVVGGVVYLGLSGLDGFIREQIETQGSQATQTNVSVSQVETKLADAKVSIKGLTVTNPQGFSSENAFSLDNIRLDLGTSTQEPYVIEELLIDSPSVLYEVDKEGKANLIVIQKNVQSSLPQSQEQPQEQEENGDKTAPLMSVKKVTIKDVKLRLNIEAMDLGDLPLEKRQFELTLPTFYADAIGVPNGIPADQLGAAVIDAMLDNLIKEAKNKVKNLFKDEAKAKAKEKLDKEKDKLKDKAKEKLKGLFGN